MKFDYMVKLGGKYYLAGEDVPVDGASPVAEPKVETEVKVAEPVVEKKKATRKKAE